MSNTLDAIARGYRTPTNLSPATIKIARKQRDAAARFVEDPAMERALAWRDAGDVRFDRLPPSTQIAAGYYANDFDRLPPSTQIAAGYYANDRAAHAAERKQR